MSPNFNALSLTRRRVLAGLGASLASGATSGMAQAAGPRSVVATTGMIADAARVLYGDQAQVTALMGPGVDPHSYRQTRSDIVALTRADLILRHGLYLEAQMEDVFAKLARKTEVISVAEVIPVADRLTYPGHADRFDPHIWMDPGLWAPVVDKIATALDTGPEAQERIEVNRIAYQAQIARLRDYAGQALSSVPEPARVLVTAHDAFGYFGRAFGFEVLGIQGISTESEAGLTRIRDLVNILVERRIGAVFVESSVSDRNMRALIEGAAARGHEVTVGGELFSDAMGQPGSYEGTYLGMIDHNVTTIAQALGGAVSPRGMDGKLSAGL